MLWEDIWNQLKTVLFRNQLAMLGRAVRGLGVNIPSLLNCFIELSVCI